MWTRASKIKLVIETGKELEFYSKILLVKNQTSVFLQPESYNRDFTLPLVQKLLREYPHCRLSIQLHKYLGIK